MINLKLPLITSSEDWEGSFLLTDAETGSPIDINDCIIRMSIVGKNCGYRLNLTSESDEIMIVDLGVFTWYVPQSKLRGWQPDVYDVGCVIEDAFGGKQQLFLGTQGIAYGVVR